jgi:hypothetical protein
LFVANVIGEGDWDLKSEGTAFFGGVALFD